MFDFKGSSASLFVVLAVISIGYDGIALIKVIGEIWQHQKYRQYGCN